ncbi:MAG: ROK family protein [Eubacteriales bacterium]
MFIDKDTIFLLQYDLVRLNLRERGCTIGIYYGTGIGNAVFIDSKFLVGKHGVAGELGHIPYFGGTNICGCGGRSCAETHAGGYVLRNLWKQHFAKAFSQRYSCGMAMTRAFKCSSRRWRFRLRPGSTCLIRIRSSLAAALEMKSFRWNF